MKSLVPSLVDPKLLLNCELYQASRIIIIRSKIYFPVFEIYNNLFRSLDTILGHELNVEIII